ncbi:MAG: hypothetical protein ACD_80C00009G0008 [uncultured bacterium (gcode 4)]|uniref:Uncharacterized protein n=1 Tax=uncultured bacterium (gcode 4) TaxID=1234023 RepID=K1XZC5_9BACT|nr:MAG: hypothetical protein ACD_80C00009G0008 [uncultured bacterium (gcode 4)]
MKDFLHPYGNLDVLWRYGKVAPYLKKFLKGKEIASKIVGEDFVLLKRGTKNPPLFIDDFDEIDEKYLELRATHHLDEVKDQLTSKQILLRKYFVPRKLINFFYACNNEYGNTIDRIFIDIDRQDNSADDARKVTLELIRIISSDKQFTKLIDYKTLILRTGASFHVYLLLKKPIDHAFYDSNLSYGKDKENSFISRRAREVSQATKIHVFAAHERKKWAIILDTSNTPPGKLARCPFSLHIKDSKTIDSIAVPVSEQELADPKLISKLEKLTPESIWKDIKKYSSLLP